MLDAFAAPRGHRTLFVGISLAVTAVAMLSPAVRADADPQKAVESSVDAAARRAEPAAVIGIELTDGDDLLAIHDGEEVSAVSDSGEAIGIAALAGEDGITNRGLVLATSDVLNDADVVIVDEGGDYPTNAEARATAISGGTGDDMLANETLIDADALASALASDIDVTLPDGEVANVSLNATAVATGIDGGEGDDFLTNATTGVVDPFATSTTRVDEVSATLHGLSFADAASIATARATALDGAAGRDFLTNAGIVETTAEATAEAAGVFEDDQGEIDGRILADSTTRALDGGADDDTIHNDGSATASATSWAGTSTYRTEFTGDGSVVGSTTARADAGAITAGEGADDVRNAGDLSANASATTEAFGLFIGSVEFKDGLHADASVLAEATASGIEGNDGDDRLVNHALIDADATATTEVIGVEVSAFSVGTTLASATSDATAAGIDGGAGADTITNHGAIEAGATATTDTDDYEFSATGIATASTAATANTDAVGIAGGAGADTITNHGTILAIAGSDATALSLTVDIGQFDVISDGDGQTTADAHAAGVESGDDDDVVLNANLIEVDADAKARTDMIDVELIGGARSDFSTRAVADSAGIDTGEGDDSINSTGTLDVEARAEVDSLEVEVRSIGFPPPGLIGAIGGLDLGSSETTAATTAMGIDTGDGNDEAVLSSVATVKADSEADSIEVTVQIAIPSIGGSGSKANGDDPAEDDSDSDGNTDERSLSESGTIATAEATGIDGGQGNDSLTVSGSGDLQVDSIADAVSGSVDVSLDFAHTGAIPSVTTAINSSQTTAGAWSEGLTGGEGSDTITNAGGIRADADADATSWSVEATIQGYTKTWLTAGVAVSDGTTQAVADAVCLAGQSGDDTITNSGSLTSEATADALGWGVLFEVQGLTETGLSIQGAATLSDTDADATATGIDGGEGSDTLASTGDIDVDAIAYAESDSIELQIQGVVHGTAGAQLAFSSTDSEATAEAVGIDGGEGDDSVRLTGGMDVHAESDTISNSVVVGIQGVVDGIGIQGALSSSNTTAIANATAIDTGDGDDGINCAGDVEVTSNADADSVDVAVEIRGIGEGIVVGGALSLADTRSEAEATGIDAGIGNDTITQSGLLSVDSDSTATSVLVGVTVDGVINGGGLGVALTHGSTFADSTAEGIAGQDGDDTITSSGEVIVDSCSDATSAEVSVDVIGVSEGITAGASLAFGDTRAEAGAVGVNGGAGADQIRHEGTLDIDSEALSTSASVAVTLQGIVHGGAGLQVALVNANTQATSDATGIDSGKNDDTIVSMGGVDVSSTAHADATGVTVTATGFSFGASVGASLAWVDATAESTAIGFDTGAGNDRVENGAAVSATSTATADTTAVAVTIDLIGVAMTNSAPRATADATAIDTGDGDDFVQSTGSLDATATATAASLDVDVNLIGAALADALSRAEATATGIDAGTGNDEIVNRSTLNATAHADADSQEVVVDLVGYSGANAENRGEAIATGIAGGEGDDRIRNEGAATVLATSNTTADGVSVVVGGLASGYASLEGRATATGIDGGSGDDEIVNAGSLTVGPSDGRMAYAYADGFSFTLGGLAGSDVQFGAWGDSYGIAGDAGDDTLRNDGLIDVTAGADAYGESGVFDFTFLSWATGIVTATSDAVAMGGADGDDVLVNDGVISVLSRAWSFLEGAAETTLGVASATTSTTATAIVRGVDGGDGEDLLSNSGSIEVEAVSHGDGYADADVGWGEPTANANAHAVSDAAGIDGGEGDDTIENEGAVTARAVARTSPKADADSDIDDTYAYARSDATAIAAGIADREGDGDVYNSGTLTVEAVATTHDEAGTMTEARTDEISGVGTGPGDPGVVADATATGVVLGDGTHSLINDGIVDVSADANGYGYAYSHSNAYDTDAKAWAGADVFAAGLSTGDGDSTIANRGAIDVVADGHAFSRADSDSVGGAHAFAGTVADVFAAGIATGNGSAAVTNDGSIDVSAASIAESHAWADPGTLSHGHVKSDTDAVADAAGILAEDGAAVLENSAQGRIEVLADALSYGAVKSTETATQGTSMNDPWATSSALARGMVAGDGNHRLLNAGEIEVRALSQADAKSYCDSNEFDTTTNTFVHGAAIATGLETGAGNSEITNEGSLYVGASATGKANRADSHVDYPKSDSWYDAWAYSGGSGHALATGILAGAGESSILNSGDIDVNAEARSEAYTRADSGAGDDLAKSISVALAEAVGLEAAGAEEGCVRIENRGSLDVSAESSAWSYGHGDEQSEARSTATASAVGVVVRAGAAEIVNGGDITVSASTSAEATAVDDSAWSEVAESESLGIETSAGDDTIVNDGTLTVVAEAETRLFGADAMSAGILTGDGADTVTNNGTITVSATADSFFFGADARSVGIATGDGDDAITNDGVIVTAETEAGTASVGVAINSGEGSDVVVLGAESETWGDVRLEAGDDSLTIHGGAMLSGAVSGGDGTDLLELLGVGTCVVEEITSVERIDLGGGTLEVIDSAGMSLDSTMVLETTINHAGNAGMLQAVSIEAGGNLVVHAADWAYTDGTTYRILSCETMSGEFDEIVMPESTAFLDFEMQTDDHGAQVGVAVASFASAAAGPVETGIAGVLDASLPVAEGDMSRLIGNFQLAGAGQVRQAFASLGPGVYDALSRASADVARMRSAGLQYRLDLARLATGRDAEGDDHRGRGLGVWVLAGGRWGDVDQDRSYAGFSSGAVGIEVGADVVRERTVYGGAIGYDTSDVEEDLGLSNGDLGTLSLSGYGGYMFGRGFVQSGLSLGRGSYDTLRNVEVGNLLREARGDYDGTTLCWGLKGGYGFDVGDWTIEPYGLLDWIRTSEDAVTETGAGAADLIVDERTTNWLFSQLGARVIGSFDGRNGRLRPEFLLAWSHDLDTGDREITAALAGTPDQPFTVPGRDIDGNGTLLGAGFVYSSKGGWSAAIRLDGEWRGNARAHGLQAQYRRRF